MSDEYHDSGNYKGSLVQESIKDALPNNGTSDTTSEGGYGGDAFSRQSQRGIDPFADNRQDPRQRNNIPGGPEARNGDEGLPGRVYPQATEVKSKDYPGYDNNNEMDASRYAERRGEGYESSAAGKVYKGDVNA